MGRRYRIKSRRKSYVERDRHGRFKNWTSIKRSHAVDRRIQAKTIVKSGYGHRGDRRRKTSPSSFNIFGWFSPR